MKTADIDNNGESEMINEIGTVADGFSLPLFGTLHNAWNLKRFRYGETIGICSPHRGMNMSVAEGEQLGTSLSGLSFVADALLRFFEATKERRRGFSLPYNDGTLKLCATTTRKQSMLTNDLESRSVADGFSLPYNGGTLKGSATKHTKHNNGTLDSRLMLNPTNAINAMNATNAINNKRNIPGGGPISCNFGLEIKTHEWKLINGKRLCVNPINSGLRSWALGLGSQVLALSFMPGYLKLMTSDLGHRTLDLGHRTLDLGLTTNALTQTFELMNTLNYLKRR